MSIFDRFNKGILKHKKFIAIVKNIIIHSIGLLKQELIRPKEVLLKQYLILK